MANDPHADLTMDEMLELIGTELETADPDGLDGRWIHLIATAVVIVAALGVLRWRGTRTVDELDEDPSAPSELPLDDRR